MIRFIILFILFFLFYNNLSFAQTKSVTLRDKSYVLEKNKWFVLDSQTSEKYEINPRSLTVKLKMNVPKVFLKKFNKSHRVIIKSSNKLGYINLELPENSNIFDIYDLYNKSGLCELVEINSYGKPLEEPNDEHFIDQYYLNYDQGTKPDINAVEAWDIWTGNSSVVVAVIDDGIQLDHEDLCLWWQCNGWDFVDNDACPDAEGLHHGTHVAGIAAAKTHNGIGIAGVAGGWNSDGSPIMALRVMYFDEENQCSAIKSECVGDAIIFAADHNRVKIINMSFKVDNLSSIRDALRYAYEECGCLLVAAAGNNPDATTPYFPARDSHVMAVAGIYWHVGWAHYGNTGSQLEVTAPADDIFSTGYGDAYGSMDGTSAAAPQVSGTAALLWSKNPNLINFDVRKIIKLSAEPIGPSNEFGKGLLKADQALDLNREYYTKRPEGISISAPIGGHPTITWNTVQSLLPGNYYNIYRSDSEIGRYCLLLKGQLYHNSDLSTHSWTDEEVHVDHPRFANIYYYYRVTSCYGYETDDESITSEEVSCGSNSLRKNDIQRGNNIGFSYKLFNNYPNPFNSSTKITYTIKEQGHVLIRVYDALGKIVDELVNGIKDAGTHTASFNKLGLSSGVYYYSINSNGFSDTKKMLLMK